MSLCPDIVSVRTLKNCRLYINNCRGPHSHIKSLVVVWLCGSLVTKWLSRWSVRFWSANELLIHYLYQCKHCRSLHYLSAALSWWYTHVSNVSYLWTTCWFIQIYGPQNGKLRPRTILVLAKNLNLKILKTQLAPRCTWIISLLTSQYGVCFW